MEVGPNDDDRVGYVVGYVVISSAGTRRAEWEDYQQETQCRKHRLCDQLQARPNCKQKLLCNPTVSARIAKKVAVQMCGDRSRLASARLIRHATGICDKESA